MLSSKQEDDVQLGFTGTLIELLKDEDDDENLYRFVVAFGTLVSQSDASQQVAKIMEAKEVIKSIQVKKSGQDRMQKATLEIMQLLH